MNKQYMSIINYNFIFKLNKTNTNVNYLYNIN